MISTAVFRRLRDTRPLFLLCVGLTIVAIVGQTWWTIAQDRTLTLEQEATAGLAAARTIEDHAGRTLQDAARAVAAVIDTIRASPGGAIPDDITLHNILMRQWQESEHIQSIRFININGVSTVTTFSFPSPAIDVSDRQYIRQLLTSKNPAQLVIGHPVKSRYDNQWILPIARNVHGPGGVRLGVISAYISIPYFSKFYERIAADRHAVVSLHATDGTMIVRSPYEEQFIGRDVSASPLVRGSSQNSVEGTFFSGTTEGGPQFMFHAYRKLHKFPVTAVYSREMDQVLARWRGRSKNRVVLAGMTVGLIGLLAFFLMTHMRRLSQAEQKLRASETRYRALYESATEAIFLVSSMRVIVDGNPAALRMVAASGVDHVIGGTLDEFLGSRVATPNGMNIRAMIDAAFDGQPRRFELAGMRHGVPACDEVSLSLAIIDEQPMLFCVFRDITARKHAELLQKGQNRVLHLIGTDAELTKILEQISNFTEQASLHAHCLLLLVADDQSRFTSSIGAALPAAVQLRLTANPAASALGVISETLASKCPVILPDLESDPVLSALLNEGQSQCYRACSSWPIMSKHGQILGIFSLLYQQPGSPSNEDMLLARIGTDLAGIAIEGSLADETIRHIAHHDELTGLPNRFLYFQHLEIALSHSRRNDRAVGVLFLDLDRFKYVNDSFGHAGGDAVLREISLRFQRCLRETDIIARVGGDEFIVLVEDFNNLLQLADLAQRLLHEAVMPFEIDGQECQLSVSIGIATHPIDGADARTLLKNADAAMYRAKAKGKNNYQFYSATMNTQSVDRLALETSLRRAIERREFVVQYQPKIDVASGRISGAEALVRWQHPQRGLLYPGAFIGLAEEAGLIAAIGRQVLENACAGIRAFQDTGVSFGRVAINLSAGQFNESGLLTDLTTIVSAHGIAPSCLEFEITESMIMHNRDEAAGLMDRMREFGFTLSIDDFGTGYSSLTYLKRFPVDSVKVDKSFINDIPHDANDSAIVQAIIVMAHTLGLKVTAEGVETATQLDILRGFGCDEYQGFYFSKAIPEADFVALLRAQHVSQTA